MMMNTLKRVAEGLLPTGAIGGPFVIIRDCASSPAFPDMREWSWYYVEGGPRGTVRESAGGGIQNERLIPASVAKGLIRRFDMRVAFRDGTGARIYEAPGCPFREKYGRKH